MGPELCVRLAQAARAERITAFGDPDTLLAAAAALKLPLRLVSPDDDRGHAGELALHAVPNAVAARFGEPDPRNARAVIDALRLGADACLRGHCDGLVTGPVHKAVINDGGIPYTGTTELLATQANRRVVMMLANPTMRVALATTHLPLRDVADASIPTPERPDTWGARRSTSSNRCWRCCAAKAWTFPDRCRQTPLSCPPACADSTRCWRCTTTRGCRC